MRKSLLFSALAPVGTMLLLSPLTAFADPREIPDNAVDQYLQDDMKTVPDGVYIPYPEDVERFKESPFYKFMEKIVPNEAQENSPPSGGRCGVNKKLFENA